MLNKEIIEKNYFTQAEAAKALSFSLARISQLCSEGKFEGAMKIGWSWIIPKLSIENFHKSPKGRKPKPKGGSERTILINAIAEAQKWQE